MHNHKTWQKAKLTKGKKQFVELQIFELGIRDELRRTSTTPVASRERGGGGDHQIGHLDFDDNEAAFDADDEAAACSLGSPGPTTTWPANGKHGQHGQQMLLIGF